MFVIQKLAILVFALLLISCSAQQVEVSRVMVKSTGNESVFLLEEKVVIKAKRTAPTTLRAGTRWSQIGSIEQGDIFDTKDQVVIVNSFDVHEASIVVNEQTIVGYYLTVEKTFVETDPVKIILIGER